MKFKLTKEQIAGLYRFLSHVIGSWEPTSIADKLIMSLIKSAMKKARTRWEAVENNHRTGGGITLSEHECLALYVGCSALDVKAGDWLYERLIVKDMLNQIDKIYA